MSAEDGLIEWAEEEATTESPYVRYEDHASPGSIVVSSAAFGPSMTSDILQYETDTYGPERIRYAQIAFIDTSWGDPAILTDASRFRSFPSGQHSELLSWMDGGGIGRMWSFTESDANSLSVPPNFTATDEPLSDWYRAWADEAGAWE